MSASHQRLLEPGWILHRRPYRDSSLLLELWTETHGRVGAVARGARGGRSRNRALLQPFVPLRLSMSGRGELMTLTGAEADGHALVLAGDALLAGFYVNELIVRLLVRDDPAPALWVPYREVLEALAGGQVAVPLRRFELALLEALGYGLNLEHDIVDGAVLEPQGRYEYVLEAGPRRIEGDAASGGITVDGSTLIGLREGRFADRAALHAARRLLGASLDLYLGGRPLRSREVLHAMRRFAGPGTNTREGGER